MLDAFLATRPKARDTSGSGELSPVSSQLQDLQVAHPDPVDDDIVPPRVTQIGPRFQVGHCPQVSSFCHGAL